MQHGVNRLQQDRLHRPYHHRGPATVGAAVRELCIYANAGARRTLPATARERRAQKFFMRRTAVTKFSWTFNESGQALSSIML